jgi:hypothetical protein
MLTYAIGLPEDILCNLQRYLTYDEAVHRRPNMDYDVLYVYKGEDIVLVIALEEIWQKYIHKPYPSSFKFHDRMERLLRFCLRGHQ